MRYAMLRVSRSYAMLLLRRHARYFCRCQRRRHDAIFLCAPRIMRDICAAAVHLPFYHDAADADTPRFAAICLMLLLR